MRPISLQRATSELYSCRLITSLLTTLLLTPIKPSVILPGDTARRPQDGAIAKRSAILNFI